MNGNVVSKTGKAVKTVNGTATLGASITDDTGMRPVIDRPARIKLYASRMAKLYRRYGWRLIDGVEDSLILVKKDLFGIQGKEFRRMQMETEKYPLARLCPAVSRKTNTRCSLLNNHPGKHLSSGTTEELAPKVQTVEDTDEDLDDPTDDVLFHQESRDDELRREMEE